MVDELFEVVDGWWWIAEIEKVQLIAQIAKVERHGQKGLLQVTGNLLN